MRCVQLLFSSCKEEEATLGLTVATAATSYARLGVLFIYSTSLFSPLQVPFIQTKTFSSASPVQTGMRPLHQPSSLEKSHEKLELLSIFPGLVGLASWFPSGNVLRSTAVE